MAINAYRRARWEDGVDFGQCLACGDHVADPDVFCTHCGTRWERCVLDREHEADRERRPGRGQGWKAERYWHEPWVLQLHMRIFDDVLEPPQWYSFDYAYGPFDAHVKLQKRREHRQDDGEVYRALPLRLAQATMDSDHGEQYVDLLTRNL